MIDPVTEDHNDRIVVFLATHSFIFLAIQCANVLLVFPKEGDDLQELFQISNNSIPFHLRMPETFYGAHFKENEEGSYRATLNSASSSNKQFRSKQ